MHSMARSGGPFLTDARNYTGRRSGARPRNKKQEEKKMYRVMDYYTGEVIDVVNNPLEAIAISRTRPDSEVVTDTGEHMYANIDIPF